MIATSWHTATQRLSYVHDSVIMIYMLEPIPYLTFITYSVVHSFAALRSRWFFYTSSIYLIFYG